MMYKNVFVDFLYGGGKVVIIGDLKIDKLLDLFCVFGEVVESLKGDYIIGEDVGMKFFDFFVILECIKFVIGILKNGVGGDFLFFIVLGVYYGMCVVVEIVFGKVDFLGF